MERVYRDLHRLICKDCENLNYWDGYFCKRGRHERKDKKLSRRALKHCDAFVDRGFGKREYCRKTRCVFWCNDCEAYREHDR